MRVDFDRPVGALHVRAAGHALVTSCVVVDGGCSALTATVDLAALGAEDGFHLLEVATEPPFRTRFLLARAPSALAAPDQHAWPLVGDGVRHVAPGAGWVRMRHADRAWSAWRRYEASSAWRAECGLPVLAQYHAGGSAAYLAADCVTSTGRCHPTYHGSMFWRGELNQWRATPMQAVGPFTWGANVTLVGTRRAALKLDVRGDWTEAYGVIARRRTELELPEFDPRSAWARVVLDDGTDATRRVLMQRGEWSAHRSILTATKFAANLEVTSDCLIGAGTPPVAEGNDYLIQITCCLLFDDLRLNVTVSSDLAACVPREVLPGTGRCSAPAQQFSPAVRAGLLGALLALASQAVRAH